MDIDPVESQIAHNLRRATACLSPIDYPRRATMRGPSEKDVFRYAYMVKEAQFLVDRSHPELDRMERTFNRRGAPIQNNLAMIGTSDARQDLHQRRFARAVFAAQRQHAPFFGGQRDVA